MRIKSYLYLLPTAGSQHRMASILLPSRGWGTQVTEGAGALYPAPASSSLSGGGPAWPGSWGSPHAALGLSIHHDHPGHRRDHLRGQPGLSGKHMGHCSRHKSHVPQSRRQTPAQERTFLMPTGVRGTAPTQGTPPQMASVLSLVPPESGREDSVGQSAQRGKVTGGLGVEDHRPRLRDQILCPLH